MNAKEEMAILNDLYAFRDYVEEQNEDNSWTLARSMHADLRNVNDIHKIVGEDFDFAVKDEDENFNDFFRSIEYLCAKYLGNNWYAEETLSEINDKKLRKRLKSPGKKRQAKIDELMEMENRIFKPIGK